MQPGVRLDVFLFEKLGDKVSRTRIQKLIEDGSITAGVRLKSSFKAKSPLEVRVRIPEEKPMSIEPVDLGVPVLFQDKHLAIIHKPAGMTVHPGANTGDDTLVHSLLAQLKNLAETESPDRPGIVHRIDRETEGLLIIAKTASAHSRLAQLFKERKIEKTYHAIVWGKLPEKGIYSGFIGRDAKDRKKMKYSEKALNESYRQSLTEYETVATNQFFTLLKIKLVTGRTHQIRATFAAKGHPVVGDTIYSVTEREARKVKAPKLLRQKIEKSGMLLIASHLKFSHPVNKKKLTFSLELPERFDILMKA